MEIIISNASSAPIYEQIYTQIRGRILSGELQPGAPLPSIRALAKDLRISVITTKRAYDELEKDGFLNTVAGKGCYIAEANTALLREAQLRRVEEQMREAAALARACGMGESETLSLFRLILEEEQP